MPELETRDLYDVEILSTGGPVHGVGSPPEGDYWTSSDLRAMVSAAAELGDEVKAPNKIGHSSTQALLANSDLAPVSAGEMPAAGWLSNLRLNDDGTKLVADILDVPATVADLIEAKAYRTRSVELSKITSQVTQKTYDWVVTGLAWLGGKMPAVRTLDDVVAMYETDDLALEGQPRAVIVYAAGDVVWAPTDGYQAIREAISEVLNGSYDPMVSPRFWVCDVADGRALVEDWEDPGRSWVVPFTGSAKDGVGVSERGAWIPAEQAWLESAKRYSQRPTGVPAASSDSSVVKAKYTDEQRRTFAEATGLEQDKVTDEMLANAGVPSEDTPAPTPDPARENEAADQIRSLEERVAAAEAKAEESAETLRLSERRSFVEDALRSGRVEPGAREKLERLYDSDPETAREFVAELKPNDTLAREYGADGDGADEGSGDPETDTAAAMKLYEEANTPAQATGGLI